MHIVQTGHNMSMKKTVVDEITKSFAPYFNESDNHACSYVWLQRSDDDNSVDAKNNASKSVDVNDVAAEEAGSSTAITEEGQQSFDRQNGEEITSCDVKDVASPLNCEEKLPKATDITDTATDEQILECRNENEPLLAAADETQKVTQVDNCGNEEGTIDNLICIFASLENCANEAQHEVSQIIDAVDTDPSKSNLTDPNDAICAEIGDIEAASTVSDELSRYITFLDDQGKKLSSDEDKELEYLIGGEQSHSTAEAEKNDIPEAVAVDTPSECQPLITSVNKKFILESTYDFQPDPNNPMLFHIQVKTLDSLLPPGPNVTGRHRLPSFYFEGHEIKPCYIPLKDFRVRKRVPNELETMEFFLRRPKKVKQRARRTGTYNWKPQKRKPRQPTANNRKGKFSKCNIGAKTTTGAKSRMTAKPSTLWDTIQESYPKQEPAVVPSAPTKAALQRTPTFSIEEKNVSIKEWLEFSSQAQADDNVDVNEFLQFASLPILSDIEDDAYQLSTFLDFSVQPKNESKSVSTVNPMVHVPQQFNDEIPAYAIDLTTVPVQCVQPLDLSTKQTTPMSTDTGFCNESVSLDTASPFHTCSVPAQAVHAYPNVRNADDKKCVVSYGQRKDVLCDTQTDQQAPSTSWLVKSSTSQNVDTKTELPLCAARQAKKKQECVDVLLVKDSPVGECSQPLMKAAQEVNHPPEEEKIPQRVTFPPEWKIDGYSTDLDYEPSEDDDNKSEDKLSITCHETNNITQPLDTDLNSKPRTDNRNKIEVTNNTSNARVLTHTFASKLAALKKPAAKKPIGPTRSVPSLPLSLSQPAAEVDIDLLKSQINYLLNKPCFDYMHDESCVKVTCRFNHNLPTEREVSNKLKLFPTETVLSMYNRFIVKNRMAFVNYFPTFCKIFSIRKMKQTLLTGVWHCDRMSKMSFYADIYRGFIGMDIPKVQALARIANVSCKSRTACTYILNIIVKEDPLFFIEMLREYHVRANLETHHMLSLLYHLYDNPAPTLLRVFTDIFDRYSRSDISDITPYKMIVYEFRSLIIDDLDLTQRFNAIVSRDNRLNL